jgi:OOP family OmpA-OmpF porin
MKKMTFVAASIVGLMGFAAVMPAFAADQGWYVLGGAGKSTGGDNGQTSLDNALTSAGASGFSSNLDSPTLYKLEAGFQLDRNWALEGGYLGSNNSNYSAIGGNLPGSATSSASFGGWNLTGVGTLPLGNGFSVLGKLGVANMQESADISSGGYSTSTGGSKTDLTYGIGAKYDFGNGVFIRADLDSYNIGNSNASSRSTVGMVDIGYKF